MIFQEKTNEVIKIKEEIFEQFPDNPELQDLIWNYAQVFLSILRLEIDEKYFNEAMLKLKKYKKWEITIEELIKHKEQITSIIEKELII